MDLASTWPWAVGAVLLLALIILIMLVLLLRKSAKAGSMGERPEPPSLDEPEPVPQDADDDASGGLATVFRRARRLLSKSADDRYEVPLYLLAGADGSRPADLLGSGGLDLPFGGPSDAGLSLGSGRGFWFFDRGVILDVAGPQMLRADGRTSDTAGWNAIVRQMQKLRPKRPIDGVIVTLSVKELLEAAANDVTRAELSARMGRIYRRLTDLQQALGFRLPGYILLTGGEKLTGFTALCESLSPRARQEMVGWSNPATVDSAYRGEWVTEAFDALGRRLDDLQMEVFADGPKHGGDLLQLPRTMRSLAGPLRTALDQLFRSSAYQSALMLRGIYVCGREADELHASMLDGAGHAFLLDLIERKVFGESGLATPNTRIVSARNRAVRIAQVATFATAIILATGLGFGAWKLHRSNQTLRTLLQDTYDDMRMLRRSETGVGGSAALQESAGRLLSGMARVEFNHYESIFIPGSFFSGFEKRLEGALGVAFEEIILRAMRRRIEERGVAIITEASSQVIPASVRMTSESNATPVPAPGADGEALDVASVEELPDFQRLQRFLSDLRDLEEHGMIFNNLSRQGGGTLKDLGALVKYAFGQELPQEFFSRGNLYEKALQRAGNVPFRVEELQPIARTTAVQLVNGVYERLFARNLFAARLQQFSVSMQTLVAQPPPKGETEPFRELARQMRDLEGSLSRPGMEWVFRRGFDLGSAFNASLDEMQRSPLLGAELANSVRESGAANWSGLRRLLAYPAPVTGPILATKNGEPEMQLSADAVLLKSGLDTFLGQGFVASPAQGRRLVTAIMPDRRLSWDPVLIEQAVGVAKAHDRFAENTLRLFPTELRATIDGVARDRAWARMWDLLCGAQQFAPVPPMNEEELRNEVTAFASSQQPLAEVLDGFDRLGYTEPRRDVAFAMTAEAARLLQLVDGMLEAEQPYRPKQGTFAWWDGSAPLSPGAWDARDPAELAGYLETTRTRIAMLARSYAQPLLTWVARAGTRDRADVRILAAKWQRILDDLRDYDAKKPGNPVVTLEDYMTTPLAKIRPSDCAAANLPAGFRGGRGYFATTLQDLSREATQRCYSLGGRDASSRYADLSRFFNQRLAGRYPFADAPPSTADAIEADPADVRTFFKLFDQSQAVIRAMPKDGSFAQPLKFVEDMAAVRSFFAPFLEAKPDASPAIDLEATFRILREREVGAEQIIGWSLSVGDKTVTNRDKAKKIRWSPGEPVRLSLRWANDAPRTPFLRSPRRGAVVKDRTVVFEYGNRWSLLTALADNRPRAEQIPQYADVEPVTLALNVDTKPVGATGAQTGASVPQEVPSQVFLRIALLAPGTTQSLDVPRFPSKAPKLVEEVAQ